MFVLFFQCNTLPISFSVLASVPIYNALMAITFFICQQIMVVVIPSHNYYEITIIPIHFVYSMKIKCIVWFSCQIPEGFLIIITIDISYWVTQEPYLTCRWGEITTCLQTRRNKVGETFVLMGWLRESRQNFTANKCYYFNQNCNFDESLKCR